MLRSAIAVVLVLAPRCTCITSAHPYQGHLAMLGNRPPRSSIMKSSLLMSTTNDITSSSSTEASKANTGETPRKPNAAADWTHLAAVLTVPAIWGTYSPLIKTVFSSSEFAAPPPILFNFLSYLVSVLCLTTASRFIPSNAVATKEIELDDNSQTHSHSAVELRAGIELGLWLFAGSMVQIIGIQSTSATRAAILVQLTTILVPIFDSLSNRRAIKRRLWISCILALVGVSLVTLDQQGGSVMASFLALPTRGDVLVCLSAVFYSMHVCRLGAFAGRVNAVRLARVKSLTELVASGVLMAGIFLFDSGQWMAISTFFAGTMRGVGIASNQLWLAVLWNGAVATALTNSMQSYGQQRIAPTTANLLYTTQPIWAAFFSFWLLNDRLSSTALCGIAVLMGAVLLSSTIRQE